MVPIIGLIKVLANGVKREIKTVLPTPYLKIHFSVLSTRARVKKRPSGLSNNLGPNLAPKKYPT